MYIHGKYLNVDISIAFMLACLSSIISLPAAPPFYHYLASNSIIIHFYVQYRMKSDMYKKLALYLMYIEFPSLFFNFS